MKDVETIPFHRASEIFESVEDSYWFCTKLLRDMDEHAPLKQRIVKHNQVSYMNRVKP